MEQVPIPHVKDYEGILWNNLPYTGLYIESVYAGQTFKQFALPPSTKIHLVGSPPPVVNEGVNKSLQLIGFSTDTTDGPMAVDTNGRLVPYSAWLLYKIKWRVSSECTIGFYTPNYLTDVTDDEARRSVLLINDRKPSIFHGSRGCFTTSYIGQFFVITDKKVAVELHIEVRVPERVSFPEMELFKPLTYDLPNGKTYAYETLVSEVDRDVTFLPTTPYIDLTSVMKSFLINTSVLLDFAPITPGPLMLKNDNEPLSLKGVQTQVVRSDVDGLNYLYEYVLSLASVKGNIQISGYHATVGPDGATFTGLAYPVLLPTDESKFDLALLQYTLTISDINLPTDAVVEYRIDFGITDEKGFRPVCKARPKLTDSDGVLKGSGEVTFARSLGAIEIQSRLKITTARPFGGNVPKVIFDTFNISFVSRQQLDAFTQYTELP